LKFQFLVLTVLLLSGTTWAKPLRHLELYGKVSLDISVVKVGEKAAPAWCYRTQGMKPEEVSVTVLRRPGETVEQYPPDPIRLLRSFARAGKAEFGVGDFGGKGFLRPEFTGFMLVDGGQDKAVVPVFQLEMEVADAAGPSRVTGRMANQIRYYPYPYWCDRDRRPVFTEKDVKKMKTDLMLGGEGLSSQATAMLSGGALRLRLPPKAGAQLSQKLIAAHSHGTALRLALQVDPRADCFLIWTGTSDREAVSIEGSQGKRLSVQWICFVGGQPKNESRQMDDGVGLLLTRKDYDRLAASVKKGNFTLPLTGSGPGKLVVEQAGNDFHDPVSGATYRTSGSWFAVEPDTKAPKGVIHVSEVVMLTPEGEIAKNLGVKPLAAYILEVEKVCKRHLIRLRGPKKVELALNCRLRPGKPPECRWAVKKPVPPQTAAMRPAFQKALEAVKAPPVLGEVHFQLRLEIQAKKE